MKRSPFPWLMLFLRLPLFLGFQALIAWIFLASGVHAPWEESAAWWMITVILADVVCLVLLIGLYRNEGGRYWNVFHLDKTHIKKDLVFMLGFLIILAPISFLPNIWSAKWLFGDIAVALEWLVRPLPLWAVVIGMLFFPLLQGIVEIPVYTMYVLPRLEKQGVRPWMAVSLVSFVLSAQHIFVPFLPDARFITYRMVMFLPFAILVTMVMRWRPRLMLYMAVVHILMDFSVAVMFLQ